jgi:hypothetical protein
MQQKDRGQQKGKGQEIHHQNAYLHLSAGKAQIDIEETAVFIPELV